MGAYRYTSTEERVYPDRPLIASPGDIVDWDEPPADGHWEPIEDAPTKAKSKTAPAAAVPNSEE